MTFHNSNGFQRFCRTASPGKLAGLAVVFCLAAFLQGIAVGQITDGTSEPPNPPKPRFPQLPDDDPKIEDEKSPPEVDSNVKPVEVVGRIRKIDGLTLTIMRNEPKKLGAVTVSKDAEVTLNREPATLKDLKANDFVRIVMSRDKPNLAAKVAAARVIHDTPPSDPPPAKARRTPPMERQALPARQGGLGLTVADAPNEGILILDVHHDTPAWSAGIQTGDYLVKADGKDIVAPDDFLVTVRSREPGEKMKIVLWRDGKTRQGAVPLTTRKAARDHEAEDEQALIIAETHGDDTVVVKRTPGRTETLDREPDKSTIVLDREPDGSAVVIDRQRAEELPRNYDELAKKYLQLQKRVLKLEQDLNRLKK